MINIQCNECGESFPVDIEPFQVIPPDTTCSHCNKIYHSITDPFTKHDQEKIRYELIPPSFLKSTGVVLTYGSIKYDDDNWKKCPKWSRYYGALLRHLIAILAGEEIDPDSGFPHIWHLNCNAAFLTEFLEAEIGEDDLPKRQYKDRTEMINKAFAKARELFDESA